MKCFIIPYIALGLVLSLLIGVEYHFVGEETLPQYFGSPFVYKKQSLGSSLEHYYSIYGLVLNVALWSVVLFYIDKVIRRIIQTKRVNVVYKGVIVLLVVFSSFHVLFDFLLVGRGFEEKLNYWYWDIDKEAEDWGGKYERQLKIF